MGIRPSPGGKESRLEASLHPGQYVTNERRLYRIVLTRLVDDESIVELEDCATLDVWLVTAAEVASMRAVAVPSPAGGDAPGRSEASGAP